MVRQYVFRVGSLLRVIEPEFYPGSPFSFGRLIYEEEDLKLKLSPGSDFGSVLAELATILKRVSICCKQYNLVGYSTKRPSSEAKISFEAACAAWRIRRELRGLSRAKLHKNDAYQEEMRAIITAAYSAIPAAEFIRSAGFWWLYQTMFAYRKPPGLHVEKWTLKRLREVGLDIADFYAETNKKFFSQPTPGAWQRSPSSAAAVDEDVYLRDSERQQIDLFEVVLGTHRSSHPTLWTPFDSELERVEQREQRKQRRWRLERGLREIAESYDKKREVPKADVIESIFQIALHVDFVRTALDMLKLVAQPSPSQHLIAAAKGVAKCTQINRIALSGERLNEWLNILKGAWERCPFRRWRRASA